MARIRFVSTLTVHTLSLYCQTLNCAVTRLLHRDHHSHSHELVDLSTKNNIRTNSILSPSSGLEPPVAREPESTVSPCACCAEDPVQDLERLQHMAHSLLERGTHNTDEAKENEEIREPTSHSHEHHDHGCTPDHDNAAAVDETGDRSDEGSDPDKTHRSHKNDEAKLMRMSINTAIAIGLHNFPEGLATFVATLNDPKVGAVLAVAIAIHNIPEGLCVAMPIYYATGQRWKAFGWAVLSGASEPLAALLGWAVLANSFTDTMYAVLFGLVAGMMVIISVRELLPTAHRYDPEDAVVTYAFIAGMCVMALSLVLFII